MKLVINSMFLKQENKCKKRRIVLASTQAREKETDHKAQTQYATMPAYSQLCPTSGSGVPAQSAAHSALNSNTAPFVPVPAVESVQHLNMYVVFLLSCVQLVAVFSQSRVPLTLHWTAVHRRFSLVCLLCPQQTVSSESVVFLLTICSRRCHYLRQRSQSLRVTSQCTECLLQHLMLVLHPKLHLIDILSCNTSCIT